VNAVKRKIVELRFKREAQLVGGRGHSADRGRVAPDQFAGRRAGLSRFAGGMSTEKYTAITGVSRATAYRELTQLAGDGLLERSGQGRGTRYALVPLNPSRI
jgi:Fic family protein